MIIDKRINSERGLPKHFQFSQSNLQDYTECRRRFQLRYILNYIWPSIQSEPAIEMERFQRQGIFFHQLAQQLFSGIPPMLIEKEIREEPVHTWWDNLLEMASTVIRENSVLYPEMTLSASFNHHRLIATYDLIQIDSSNRITIYDWKTSRKRPDQKQLFERIQSRLYPYILVHAGKELNNGNEISAESIEMIYWFPEFKDAPIKFRYSRKQLQEDQLILESLITEIDSLELGEFFLTQNEWRCNYCKYRSLCNRGETAGVESEFDDINGSPASEMFEIDFGKIQEIED